MDKLNERQKAKMIYFRPKPPNFLDFLTAPKSHFSSSCSSRPFVSPTRVTVSDRLSSTSDRLVDVASPLKHLPRPLSSHPQLPWPASRYQLFHTTHHRWNVDDCFFKSQAVQSHIWSQMCPQWQLRLQQKERYFFYFNLRHIHITSCIFYLVSTWVLAIKVVLANIYQNNLRWIPWSD